ncbi:MAG: hypothetical protein KBT47_05850 [Armatimonadetes bacterium]|nr:hypothetical protein [Candidatus Hippobium faecium]
MGVFLIFISGLSAGFRGWCIPKFRKYGIEHWLLIYIVLGVMILPWLTCFLFIPNLSEIIKSMDIKNLILANGFSVSFALANIIYSYCFVKIGFTVASSVLGGTAITFGAITPMIIKGTGDFADCADPLSLPGIITISATVLLTISVVLVSLAGMEREKQKGTYKTVKIDSSYFWYVFLSIVSGILCLGTVFISVYCQDQIMSAMNLYGTPKSLCYVGVWAFTMLGNGLTTLIYALIYIIKDKKIKNFCEIKDFFMSVSAGLLFFIYLLFLSIGSVLAGPLGASIAGGVGQAATTGGTQLLGVIYGEWKGIKGRPITLIIWGILLLFAGIGAISVANTVFIYSR